ncbi:MAG: adenine deaminase [Candidatus Heimdallarchaeota archaeon]|nr:adenine deaminase [Candidatus Heimdallarchaeota archaeon]
MNTKTMIENTLGKTKADIILKGGLVANVLTRELLKLDVVVTDRYITYIGNVTSDYVGKKTSIIDVTGRIICPGLIESHIHVESSMLSVTEFSRAVIPHGTTTCVIDPHELVNVTGIPGLEVFLEQTKKSPIRFLVEAPSCVPSLPGFETSGSNLDSVAITKLMERDDIFALAEMMNYPGVIYANEDVLAKLDAAKKAGKMIEGHAPLLKGKELQAYIAAGITSDHEASSADEVLEKLRLGMKVQVREGSFAKDMLNIFQKLKDLLIDTRNILIASDDRNPIDLHEKGHLDHSFRLAVQTGMDSLTVLQMLTYNPATHLGLSDEIGSIAPGKFADLIVVDNLKDFNVLTTIAKGKILFENGKLTTVLKEENYPKFVTNTMRNMQIPQLLDIMIHVSEKESVRVRTIGLNEHSLITDSLIFELEVKENYVVPDLKNDILPVIVVNRHTNEINIGKGFVKGLGIRNGAIASTIAHDCHQLICVGTNYNLMIEAIRELKEANGGLVVVTKQQNMVLPLQFAGIMSVKRYEDVILDFRKLKKTLDILQSQLSDPFMALAFIALPVIPHLKLTDQGLVDVDKFEFTNVLV